MTSTTSNAEYMYMYINALLSKMLPAFSASCWIKPGQVSMWCLGENDLSIFYDACTCVYQRFCWFQCLCSRQNRQRQCLHTRMCRRHLLTPPYLFQAKWRPTDSTRFHGCRDIRFIFSTNHRSVTRIITSHRMSTKWIELLIVWLHAALRPNKLMVPS